MLGHKADTFRNLGCREKRGPILVLSHDHPMPVDGGAERCRSHLTGGGPGLKCLRQISCLVGQAVDGMGLGKMCRHVQTTCI